MKSEKLKVIERYVFGGGCGSSVGRSGGLRRGRVGGGAGRGRGILILGGCPDSIGKWFLRVWPGPGSSGA